MTAKMYDRKTIKLTARLGLYNDEFFPAMIIDEEYCYMIERKKR